MQFHALGGVSVTHEGHEVNVGGPRQRRLLAMLLIHRNAVVSVDRLADAVFAGEPTPAASTTMRSYVARVRRVVEANGVVPKVVTQAPGYMLQLPDDAFDVSRFEAALTEGRSLLTRGDPAGGAAVLRDAVALWRGDAYAEFDDEDWARPEAQRLAELRLVAHEVLYEAELACGRAGAVIPEVERMVGLHPLREPFVSQLMVALYRSGRQADALRVFQAHREVLVEELGLDPSPALRLLEERILAHDTDLLAAEPGGQVLRGYRLGERLGTGRDGTVHAAHLPGLGRDLVIRVFRRELADSPDFVRSFETTAHLLASLHHPAIVPIHDYWREPGAAHLVLRRMHGGSLAGRLERNDRRALTVGEVTAIVRRIGAALVAAHEAGLVHGRVTPSEVMFDDAGEAWLTDFDLGAPADQRHREADVAGFAALVAACIPDPPAPVAGAIERGRSSTDRPAMAELVTILIDALTGEHTTGACPAPNPYKGLRAFEEGDAADFRGRSALVDELLHRLGGNEVAARLVLVVGGSGTGKSSVVRAGLLPRIRGGDVRGSSQWFVTTMLPGAAPFKELAAALRRVAVADPAGVADQLAATGGLDAAIRRLLPPDAQLLLIVDQLEELFTSAPERDQRRFLDAVMHAVTAPDSRLRVVGTLRADFYDRPLAFHPFGAVVNDVTVTIPAMSAAELERAIVEPAERAGRHVEPALVAELVRAALDEPAGLPALQFTLFELAERASGSGDLTLAGYQQLGGLSGAIAARADALYRSLDDDQRAAVRRLFGQLVVVHPESEPTRRRATRAELVADDPDLDAVIDRWADARLLSLDRHRQSRLPTVEPAHEALLREWPRLRRWIDEDREALLVLGHLREAVASWADLDRDPGGLYRGARLQLALDSLDSATLAPQDREFLDASRAARAAEEREAAAQIERQARANRRLRRQLLVIGVALVVALIGGFVALDQRRVALEQRRVAFARELAAAADANLAEDPERSMLLALEAVERTRDGDSALPEAIGSLHEAISRSRLLLNVPGLGGNLDWSADGSIFVTEGPEETGIVDVRDGSTGESVRSWRGDDIDINEVAFSADGELLATAGDDGHLRVWDPATGEGIGAFDTGTGGLAWAPSFSPDGSLVAAAWTNEDGGTVQVIDIASGEVLSRLERARVFGTDFSPDGSRVVVASIEEPGLVVFDVRTGEEVLFFGEELGTSRDARFSPDGRWIASGHTDGIVRIWDAATGERRFTVAGHRSEANAVDWSHDSSRLATAGNDGTARVHEVTAGGVRELASVAAQDTANGLAAVAFSPDADRIMTGDWGLASVKVWDLSDRAGAEWTNIVQDGGTIALHRVQTGERLWDIRADPRSWFIDIAWSPDSEHLAVALVGDDRGRVLVVDRDGEVVARVVEEREHIIRSMAFTADGELLATARSGPRQTPDSKGVRVWDWRRGEPVLTADGLANHVVADPTGARIAFTRELAGSAEIWNVAEGRHLRTIRGAGVAYGISWSHDGARIALAGADGTVRVFDADTGRLELILRGHERAVNTATFSPDGTRLASLDEAGMVRVWALDLDELIGIARSRLTRTLDAEECRQYLRSETCGA